jgi:hypothetical protein
VLFGHVASRDEQLLAAVRDWRKFGGAIPGPFEAWLVHRGLETLELPVSELLRLPTVMVFTGWLLAHARALHEAYNDALAAHRRQHRVRGRGRPMPDLAVRRDASGEWLEVPWWLWSRDDPRRRRVFASVATPGALALSDLETLRIELPIAPDTFTTLRKSLVTDVSYGWPVGALIAPLITSWSMLAAVMPPRSIRPVTGM